MHTHTRAPPPTPPNSAGPQPRHDLLFVKVGRKVLGAGQSVVLVFLVLEPKGVEGTAQGTTKAAKRSASGLGQILVAKHWRQELVGTQLRSYGIPVVSNVQKNDINIFRTRLMEMGKAELRHDDERQN